MPYTNCCVKLCVSSTRRTPNLEFYRLPEVGEERRAEWLRLIRNEGLTREPASQLTRICSLHFRDGDRGNESPSLFPWTRDWPDVIRHYNKELAQAGESSGISPLPLLTPETTGVEVPGGGRASDDQTRMNNNNKGRKRLRIWVDESEGEDDGPGVEKGNDASTTGGYMVAPEQLGPTNERRVSIPEGITGTLVPAQRSGEVVSMVMTSRGNKMSLHEKAFFSPYHSSQLLNKLADLWRMGKMCDATICIGYTIRIKAHKLVLSSMSSVIMNMAAKTEGAILELQLPGDLNVESVQKFITFLYEGVLYLSPTTVYDIQRLATIFKVDSVLGYCQTFLQSSQMQASQVSDASPFPTAPPPASLTVPFQLVAPLTPAGNPPSGAASPVLGTPSFQPVRLSPKMSSQSTDSGIWSKRPILRQQATVHGEEDLPPFTKYVKDSGLLPSKRVQELKGLWKKGSYETSEERSSPGLIGADQMLGSPLTGECGSFQSTDSPGGSFDQADPHHVKTEPEDSATESGDETSGLLPGTLLFRVDGGEGMEPPDAPGATRGRTRATTSDPTLANSDPALLTQQVRNAMPTSGVLFENLPIPDGFLSESNPEQQRRYMASLLERTQTSSIPERDRMYRCLFCPSSFVKAKSCVVHVIETHQVQAKDVLKYVSIERKGAKAKGKCPLCDYKVSKNQEHLHYHKYFQHGIALPEGFHLYRCEICGKESSSKYNWRTHMDTSHFQGNTCEMCEQSFSCRDELADHYRSAHISRRASPPKKRLRRLTKNVSAPADTSQSRLYVYKCPDCSFDSSSHEDIASHMATVHGRHMEIPELHRADSAGCEDKERLLRTQSDDRDDLERGRSEDTEGGVEGGAEETGSLSTHSEYDCESPDSSMVNTKDAD